MPLNCTFKTILIYFYFLITLCSMWDLSSLTKDQILGSNPLQWKPGDLTSGWPEKS